MGFPAPDGRGSVARASAGPAACLERAPSQVQLAIREIGPTKERAASRRQECSRRAWLATRKRRAKRGAEAPGQRTAACRLLRRVGPPVQLPLVLKWTNRT